MHGKEPRSWWMTGRRRRQCVVGSVVALLALDWLLGTLVQSNGAAETAIAATLRAYPGLLYLVCLSSSVLTCSGLLAGIVGNTLAELRQIRLFLTVMLSGYAYLRLTTAILYLGQPLGTWLLLSAATSAAPAILFRLLLTWVVRAASVPAAA